MKFWLRMTILSLIVAGLISNFASSSPDGLDYVAEKYSFAAKARDDYQGVMPDCKLWELSGSTGLAGILGVILTFFIMYGLSRNIIYTQRNSKDLLIKK